MLWDPEYSFRKFSVRVAGLSYWARFPHVKFKVTDASESERAFESWAF